MEHLDGLGLVAPRDVEELVELNARLFLVRDDARPLKALGAGLRSNQGGQVDELTRLQGDELVARLGGLKDAGGRLARRDEPAGLSARRIEGLHHAGLDTEGVLV